jgi:hypothetical protein
MAAMISGPDAGGSTWRKRPVPARARPWRVFCLAAAVAVLAPAAAARAAPAAVRAEPAARLIIPGEVMASCSHRPRSGTGAVAAEPAGCLPARGGGSDAKPDMTGAGWPDCGMNLKRYTTARGRHRSSTVSPAVVASVITPATAKEHS